MNLRTVFRVLSLALPALAWLCVTTADAQPAACPPPARVPTLSPDESAQVLSRAPDRGLLWRIEKNGRSSWLYGTMHLGRADWIYPGPRVLHGLMQSDTLALEIDLSDPATLATLAAPADAAAAARLLTPERARRLHSQIASACLPEGALKTLSPLMQATTLVILAARGAGLYGDFGTEMILSALARGRGKRTAALETAEGQLKALQGETESAQAEQIDASLDQLESGVARTQAEELAQVWERGDRARLADYASWCGCVDTPADRRAMQRLLDDRNPGLADGIARLHARGQRVFAAVGALHMVGPHGLPALMAARGFKVMQVVPAVD